ncbi:retrovirus-related pol polyprotein from transposon 17.6 [Tanacetum coccineum]
MMEAPVLALSNFKAEFTIETDASRIGLGAILQQDDHQIAYLNKALTPRHKSLSTYEKELMAIVLALDKQGTMMEAPVLALSNFKAEFTIKTDASRIGLGAILQQDDHPIAYLNKTLTPRHKSLSTYEKELMAVVLALDK